MSSKMLNAHFAADTRETKNVKRTNKVGWMPIAIYR